MLALLLLPCFQDPAPTPLLEVPDGFAVDLIAEAPDVLWPSAVHCLDDGSLLVAEDPMDMVGPADQPLDRILKLSFGEDGTSYEQTVFAEGLYAVFGLQQVDDFVLVMNMPHLTRLCDADGDGVAEEREVLIDDLGPPAPGHPGGFNDHIVSGIRLGMDGFVYIAVGDKGIPRAHGTDGSSISLRGGGVVRVRPDGSRLEVVATGLRNILDVAIDANGNIFTYDNTDDGLGWWTRLTHVVPGGHYGYPWDYHDHPERMLPAMAEYGGGSPTGGLVYREAAWPEPYRGSLFFCEWGKQVLRRFEVEPDGATFRVTVEEDFAQPGEVESFRPTDICTSPDGRFLYVADWGYGGWTADDRTGRLWRIRRADDGGRRQPIPKSTIGAEGFRGRLTSQRVIAELMKPPQWCAHGDLAECLGGIEDPSTRIHVLWILAEMGGDLRWNAIRGDLAHADPQVRIQALRALGQAGKATLEVVEHALQDEHPAVRREAYAALARSHDVEAGVPTELVTRPEPDRWIRFARRRVLESAGAAALEAHATWGFPAETATEVFEAVRGQYSDAVVKGLVCAVGNTPYDSVRGKALLALADLYRKPEPWDGRWWSIQPARTGYPPHVLEWEGTPFVVESMKVIAELDRVADAHLIEAVRRMGDPELAGLASDRWDGAGYNERRDILNVLAELRAPADGFLRAVIRDEDVSADLRGRAIDTAARIGTPEMADVLVEAMHEAGVSEDVFARCLTALGRMLATGALGAVEQALSSESETICSAAVGALVAIAPEDAGARIHPMLAHPSASVRREVVRGYGTLGTADVLDDLMALRTDPKVGDEAIRSLARHPDPRAWPAYVQGLGSKKATLRARCRDALRAVREEVRADLERFLQIARVTGQLLNEIQAIYSGLQPLVQWRVLGPFADDLIPPVEEFEDRLEREYRGAVEQVFWTEATGEPRHGKVDLNALLEPNDHVAAFALATYHSPRARTADMAVGSDDSVRVWINGELVHEFPGQRGWGPDQDSFRVRLREGANTVLLRVDEVGGDWAFNAKIAEEGSGPIFAVQPTDALGPEDYRAFALAEPGDAARGRELFFGADGPGCHRCHAVGDEGASIGPALTDVGAKYARAELVRSVLEPSEVVEVGYRAFGFELVDGTLTSGLIEKEEGGVVTLVDGQGEKTLLAVEDVAERWDTGLSAMPDGLSIGLSLQDFTDLVTYLESLR